MAQIDHVICPVDLSPTSLAALRHAAVWARSHRAALRVLYVAPLPQVVVSASGQSFVMQIQPREDIRADVEHIVGRYVPTDVHVSIELMAGQAASVILDEAARHPHALLIMGTHGWTGLDRMLLGSTTERVAHRVPCPLLVVPPHDASDATESVTPSRILCAVDFRASSLAGLRYALSLAQEGKARLELVTVEERPHQGELRVLADAALGHTRSHRAALLQALAERVPDHMRQWCLVHEEVLSGSPAQVLLSYAADVQADLIVIGTGDRPHLHALWLGSTTGRLMRSARCPVLIVPGPRRVALAHAKPLLREHWRTELERLSLAYQGAPATLDIIRDDLGTLHEVSDVPFIGVTADQRDGAQAVAVMLANADGTHLTHVIPDPQDIRLSDARGSGDLKLFIVARDGTTTLLGVGRALGMTATA